MLLAIRFILGGVIIGIGLILGSGGLPGSSALADSKQADLEQKIADLSLLDQQLADRIQQAQGLRAALADQQAELASEVHVLLNSLHFKSVQQAQQNLRLRYNIALLGTILRYIDELDEKMKLYQAGRDRLGYLRQSAQDDLRLIAALSDLKIDALTTQISLVINRYLPEAHIIQIDPQQLKPLPAGEVWEIVKASNR